MQTLAVGRAHSSVHAGNIQRSPTRGWERYYSSRQAPVASTFTATLFVDIRWDLTAQDRAMPCSKGMCTLPSTPPLRPPEAGTKHWSPRILKNTVTFFFLLYCPSVSQNYDTRRLPIPAHLLEYEIHLVANF